MQSVTDIQPTKVVASDMSDDDQTSRAGDNSCRSIYDTFNNLE